MSHLSQTDHKTRLMDGGAFRGPRGQNADGAELEVFAGGNPLSYRVSKFVGLKKTESPGCSPIFEV